MVQRKKILVTGAAGGVGTHVVQQALKAGYMVRATDLSGRDFAYGGSRVHIYEGDLTDPRFMQSIVKGVDHIIHTAALTDPELPWNRLEEVNVTASRRLWEQAALHGVERVVHISAGAIYRGQDSPIGEDGPQEPFGNYERSKFLAEKALLRGRFGGGGPELVILRPAWIVGPYATALMASVATVPPLFKHYLGFAIGSRGGPRSTMVHSLDVARAAIHFLEHGDDGGIYNIASEDVVEFADYFNVACSEYGLTVLPGLPLRFPSPRLLGLLGPLGARTEPVQFLNTMGERLWRSLLKKHDLVDALKPRIDVAAVHHGLTDLILDGSRARDAGFECLFPDYRSAIRDVLERYRRVRWIP